MPEPPLIEVKNVSKKFCRRLKPALWYGFKDIASDFLGSRGDHRLTLRPHEFLAVDDVSFEVRRGECVGLIGPNGAGKSTLLKMLNGLIRPDAGEIHMRGRVGALIELGTGFNPILTGRENVFINGSILGFTKKEIAAKFDEIHEFSEIGDAIDAPVQTYSSGMKVRLGFAVASHMEPDIMLIDEVLAVGDTAFRMKCYKHLSALINDGTSVVVVSHNTSTLSRVSNRGIVIGNGSLAFDGELAQGIAVYDELLYEKRGLNNAGNVQTWDLGVARIVNCVTRNITGQSTGDFQTGDTINIDVEIEAPVGTEVKLNLFIESPSIGIVGAFASAAVGYKVTLESPRQVIRASLGNFPLLVGAYFVNVGLLGGDEFQVYDISQGIARFRIIGPPLNAKGNGYNGLIKFDANWSSPDRVLDPVMLPKGS